MDRSCVESCAAAARRDEQFALERVEYHRKFHSPATLVGNRHAELREAVREVGGAVKRIDNPSMLALLRVRAALLGEDRMLRERAAERSDDGAFRFVVGLGHQIDRVGFARHLNAAQTLQMNPAGRARGAERHLLEFGGRRDGVRAHRGWT